MANHAYIDTMRWAVHFYMVKFHCEKISFIVRKLSFGVKEISFCIITYPGQKNSTALKTKRTCNSDLKCSKSSYTFAFFDKVTEEFKCYEKHLRKRRK